MIYMSDEKIREILTKNEIPDKIKPENIEIMLKNSKKPKQKKISIVYKSIATLAACIIITVAVVNVMPHKEEIEIMENAAYMLKAISNATRLRVISLLNESDELSVSQMVEELDCEQSLLSHHLTDMRARGVLNSRKDGKNCYYSLKNKQITQILSCIQSCNSN